jgi:hypothetical protein
VASLLLLSFLLWISAIVTCVSLTYRSSLLPIIMIGNFLIMLTMFELAFLGFLRGAGYALARDTAICSLPETPDRIRIRVSKSHVVQSTVL